MTARAGSTAGSAPSTFARRDTPRIWWLVLVLSMAIAAYALAYLILGERMFVGDVGARFRERPWGIYSHAFVSMFALALGPFQFRRRLRERRLGLHRTLGKIYVVAALLTGLTGLYMAMRSFGGMPTHLGFGALAVGVLVTTTIAYRRIRTRDRDAHREWMIRSFSLIFAAVTLRVLLPLLVITYRGQFAPAYLLVAWLCWVPNILWAEWYIRRTRLRHTRTLVQAPA
jgi:uncharacterized membrane protein